jgi:hypothetical protein
MESKQPTNLVVFVNVTDNYPDAEDPFQTAANVLAEIGDIALHGDVVFELDAERCAILIRTPSAFVVELTSKSAAPPGLNPFAQEVSLKPLVLKPDFNRAECAPRHSNFRQQTQCTAEWTSTNLCLLDADGKQLSAVDLTSEQDPIPYRVLLDNS